MTEQDPIMPSELGAYTNNSPNKEGIKKLCDVVNNIEVTTDVYTKEETNTLLAGKQDVLTAGTGITISEQNIISANTEKSFVLKNGDWSEYFTLDTTNKTFTPKKNMIVEVQQANHDSNYKELFKGITYPRKISVIGVDLWTFSTPKVWGQAFYFYDVIDKADGDVTVTGVTYPGVAFTYLESINNTNGTSDIQCPTASAVYKLTKGDRDLVESFRFGIKLYVEE